MPQRPRLVLECPCGATPTLALARARTELFCQCGRPIDVTAEDERQAWQAAAAEARENRGKNRGLK